MVARNFRTARHHGEIDLIGWDKDVLCFIEVKTRTTHDVKPALAAVDRKKRHDIRVVISDYLRPLPEQRQWRFDVVTVYYEGRALQPIFEVFKNCAFVLDPAVQKRPTQTLPGKKSLCTAGRGSLLAKCLAAGTTGRSN